VKPGRDEAAHSGRSVEGDEQAAVTALVAATRLLVGVATRAAERAGPEVSLAEFRLLLALTELGASPSARAAEWLGVAGSSVTRLGDRLEESGHLRRRRERPNRSVVRLELTKRGAELVERVMASRRGELAMIVGGLPPGTADQVAAAVRMVVDAAGAAFGAPTGPAELRAL
jgi:DNA-binding MarR family transcriptional regulator